jgi:hypothetical protein
VRASRPTTRYRATTLKTKDISSSTSATSTSAARWRSLVTSANSLARRLDIVWAGAKGDGTIWFLLPITIVTAIVSPAARARPSMTAPNRPLRLYLSISLQLCHQVAPSATVPSTCARGTPASTSRLMAVMMGTIMTARISPPLNMSRPVSGSGRVTCFAPTVAVCWNIQPRPSTSPSAAFASGSTPRNATTVSSGAGDASFGMRSTNHVMTGTSSVHASQPQTGVFPWRNGASTNNAQMP